MQAKNRTSASNIYLLESTFPKTKSHEVKSGTFDKEKQRNQLFILQAA